MVRYNGFIKYGMEEIAYKLPTTLRYTICAEDSNGEIVERITGLRWNDMRQILIKSFWSTKVELDCMFMHDGEFCLAFKVIQREDVCNAETSI